MKTSKITITVILSALFLFTGIQNTEAQILKKLKKKAENAATRKLEDKTTRETEKVMDTILGNDGGGYGGGTNSGGSTANGNSKDDKADNDSGSSGDDSYSMPETDKEEVSLYVKSDWVAGEQLILFDDFGDDPVGDFPQLWNTNGYGQIITLSSDSEQKWLRLYNRTYYEPDLPKVLPKEFTVEFDLATYNLTNKNTSQTAYLYIVLGDGKKPLNSRDMSVSAAISPYPNWVKPVQFKSYMHPHGEIVAGNVEIDIREAIANGAHVAISVNGKRYRLYINGKKILDFPRAIREDMNFGSILFHTYGVGDDKQNVLISNLRVAEGLPEPREKLIKTGKYVTNAILFDVNSAQIKPESYGILREISEALKTDESKKVKIVGHTDSDGSENYNLQLSKDRAASVKDALVNSFGIASERLSTDGRGESEPIAYNTSPSEKAKNRRTEFIVQ